MKKGLKLFSLMLITVLFSSCDMLLQLLNDNQNNDLSNLYKDERSYKWNIDQNGNVYFVKYNISSNYKINSDFTGYVADIDYRNANLVENESIIKKDGNIAKFNNDNSQLKNDNEFINKLNHDFEIAMKEKIGSRSSNVSNSSIKSQSKAYVNDERDFYLIKDEYNSAGALTREFSVRNTAKCKYVGNHCNVWFIDNSNYCSEQDFNFKELAETFDKIYEKETAVMGSNKYTNHNDYYIDGNVDKVQIILCDCMCDSYKNQDSGTFGYFSIVDLYKNSVIEEDYKNTNWKDLKSNEDQIIYIDSLFYSYIGEVTENNENGYNAREQILSTIPHEFNHLLNHIQKHVIKNLSMETWYTEMLALIAEDLFMESLDIAPLNSAYGRLRYFNDYYNYGFTTWYSGDDVFISYANAFAYGAFLCRNYGGEQLIKEIATNGYVNEESITKALQKLGYNKTYKDTVKEIANVLINTTKYGITLNKEGTVETDGLSLEPINLNNNNNFTSPKLFKKNEAVDIYPNGFSIHYLGKDIKSFYYYKALNEAKDYVDYGVIIK